MSQRKIFLVTTVIFLMLISCTTVPITGRKQLNIIPNSTMLSMSFQQYDEFLKQNRVSKDPKKVKLVKNVGRKIRKAVEEYMSQKGMSDQLKGYKWEFNLVENDQVNAWCMPGGKVVVYTGILPITKNESGLAVIIGHEIAHAIAEHGNERMSQSLMTQLGGMALAKAIEEKPEQTQQLWMAAFGAGAQLGYMLPYSRLHENEADHLGLIFMAMAGYDPHQAVGFWKRMAEMKEGQAPPEFVSTHPSDKNRIKNLKKLLPETIKFYKEAKSRK